ncbi:class I SAM-dependent methyltransferase [Herbidospora sp. RD11066]
MSFGKIIGERAAESPGTPLDVLVAGCGRGEPLELGGVDCRVTGVDEDRPALRAHTTQRPDLHVYALGDMRSVPMTPRGFDVVTVEFLLERIEYAELVLDRMVNALRPGGLLLVRVRDRESAYGFVDRIAPDWLRKRFGEPLPAVYESVCSREGLRAYCLMRGLMIAEDRSDTTGPARLGPRRKLVETVCRAAAYLSRGRLDSVYDEVTLIVRRPRNHFARII